MIRKVIFHIVVWGGKYSSILEAEHCGCRWNVPVPFSTTVGNSPGLFVGQDTISLIGCGTAYKYPSFNFWEIGINSWCTKFDMVELDHFVKGSTHKRVSAPLGSEFSACKFCCQDLLFYISSTPYRRWEWKVSYLQ